MILSEKKIGQFSYLKRYTTHFKNEEGGKKKVEKSLSFSLTRLDFQTAFAAKEVKTWIQRRI